MIGSFCLGLRAMTARGGLWCALFAALAAFMVTMMLGAALALPSALGAADQRANDRYPLDQRSQVIHAVANPIYGSTRRTIWRGQPITVVEILDRPGLASATPPPGLDALPSAGQSIVSPHLKSVLRQAGNELSPRIPPASGTVGASGLQEPDELIAYVGTNNRAAVGRNFLNIQGWGYRGGNLFRSEISPLIAIPLAALILAPTIALMGYLLRLDARRRERRLATVQLLGGSGGHVIAADLGLLVIPILLGCAVAVLVRGWCMQLVITHALHGRFFFPGDLSPGPAAQVGIVLLLLALVVAGSFAQSLHADQLRRAEVGQVRSRRLMWLAGPVLLLVGFGAGAITATGTLENQSSQGGWIYGTAAAIALGTLLIGPRATTAVAHLIGLRGVVSDLVRSRLRAAGGSWRYVTVGIALAGLSVAVALAVLTTLDASRQTDEIIWNPSRNPVARVFVNAPAAQLRNLSHQGFGTVTPMIKPQNWHAPVEGSDGEQDLPVVLLPCTQLHAVITTNANACRPGTVILIGGGSNSVPHDVQILDTAGHRHLATSLTAHGSPVIPVQLLGSSEAVIWPLTAPQMATQLQAAQDQPAYTSAFLTIESPATLERLRNALWLHSDLEISGASESLGSVVAASDLIRDGGYYQDRMTSLLLTLTLGSLTAALLAAGCAAAIEVREQHDRDDTMTRIGAPVALLRRIHLTTALLPVLVSAIISSVTGSIMAVLYLKTVDYSQLDGVMHGFPLGTFATFIGIETLAFLAVSSACTLSARRLRTNQPPPATT